MALCYRYLDDEELTDRTLESILESGIDLPEDRAARIAYQWFIIGQTNKVNPMIWVEWPLYWWQTYHLSLALLVERC
jgi:hypothetical protein